MLRLLTILLLCLWSCNKNSSSPQECLDIDNDGNNICEILKNINNNIEKSNKIQSKLLEKLDQKA